MHFINEEWMIINRNNVKRLNSLWKFRVSLSILSYRWFPQFSSHCLLSESPSESSILSLYLGYLRILMVSINYSYSLYAEKETIEYWLPFRLFGTMASSNSIRVRKYRGHLRATQGGYSYSPLSTGFDLSLSHPSIGRTLLSSQIG